MLSRLKQNNGITLIELIVSIAILGIIVTPLSGYFTQTFRNNAVARDQMLANQLAQKYLEKCKYDLAEDTYREAGYTIQTVVRDADTGYDVDGAGLESLYDLSIDVQNPSSSDTGFEVLDENGLSKLTQTGILSTSIASVHDMKLTVLKSGSPAVYGIKLEGAGYSSTVPFVLAMEQHNNANVRITLFGPGSLKLTVDSELEAVQNEKLRIYAIRKSGATGTVEVSALNGLVETFNNIHDESVLPTEAPRLKWLKKIVVKVAKGNNYDEANKLVEISSFKRME